MNKPKVKDNWDVKFIRDGRYMPFGSAMNSYGLINKGKGITAKKFLEDMFLIADACQTLVEDSLRTANGYQESAVADSDLPVIQDGAVLPVDVEDQENRWGEQREETNEDSVD